MSLHSISSDLKLHQALMHLRADVIVFILFQLPSELKNDLGSDS